MGPLAALPEGYTLRRALAPLETADLDLDFTIQAVAVPPFDTPLRTQPVAPYVKRYPTDNYAGNVLGEDPGVLFILEHTSPSGALDIAGFAAASRFWNGAASLDDIAIAAPHRRKGLAEHLLAAVSQWAKEHGFPALRAETQNNNLAACRMYERAGFTFAGFDRCLYLSSHPGEVALFYYLVFE
jgi:streptothricin acetyltransferase